MQAESGGRCFPRVPRTLPWAGGREGCERPAEGSGDAARTGTERAATHNAEMAASSNSSLSGSSVSSGEFQRAVARPGMESLPVAVPPAVGERGAGCGRPAGHLLGWPEPPCPSISASDL